MLKRMCRWLGGPFGYLFYTLALLVLLLWLLFPKEACHRYVVQSINNSYPLLNWQVQSMTLQLTEGITLKGIEGYDARDTKKPLVRVDSVTLQPDIAGMMQTKHLQATYQMVLGKGVVAGVVQMTGWGKGVRVEGSVKGVQLVDCAILARQLEREVQGTVSATFEIRIPSLSEGIPEMEAKLSVAQGRLGLKRPILDHTVLPFSRAEFILRGLGTALQLDQGLVESELFTGEFSGDMTVSRDPVASQLDIRGTLQPRPAFFKGVDNASLLQVIRTQLKEKTVPFRVSGDLYNPGIHFEEFSLLFQSLKKELH